MQNISRIIAKKMVRSGYIAVPSDLEIGYAIAKLNVYLDEVDHQMIKYWFIQDFLIKDILAQKAKMKSRRVPKIVKSKKGV